MIACSSGFTEVVGTGAATVAVGARACSATLAAFAKAICCKVPNPVGDKEETGIELTGAGVAIGVGETFSIISSSILYLGRLV